MTLRLSWTKAFYVNKLEAFEPMVKASKMLALKGSFMLFFIGLWRERKKDVTEEHPLVPLTLYNKYKGLCEPILNSYSSNDFIVTTFRPATVCGYASRLRLDLSVNILTNHAVCKDKITVLEVSAET